MSSVFYECTEQQYQCAGAKRPCLPWKGVAERSDSFKIMIAGGNHTAIKRWLSVSGTGGVCASTELYKKTPLRLAKCRLRRLLACIAPAGA